MKGLVFNIQRYSVHDGPGIRTIVFLKGCPLRCKWCANPESQEAVPQIAWNKKACIGCKLCEKNLPEIGCHFDAKAGPTWHAKWPFDAEKIRKNCPAEAMTVIGEERTVDDVLKDVEKDAPFYAESGGGLTVSGGEPLMQADFTQALLKEAKRRHIDTAIETCGAVPWLAFEKVLPYLDHLLMDVKVLDDDVHRKVTGGSNRQILDNLVNIGHIYPKLDVLIRTPVIPGINDDEKSIGDIARFVKRHVPRASYELLKYHDLGRSKYEELRRPYPMGDAKLSNKRFKHLKAFVKRCMAPKTTRRSRRSQVANQYEQRT